MAANTNYRISGVDIAATNDLDSFVTKQFLHDAYPSLYGNLTSGGIWVWGYNVTGLDGEWNGGHVSSPMLISGINWRKLASINPWAANGAAIKHDGSLWIWGENNYGQYGNEHTEPTQEPVQSTEDTDWESVSCGGQFIAAIKQDGTLWMWGRNDLGQLGDNTTTNKSSPVQTVAGGTNWKQVACGVDYVLATKTDGTLWAWGHNSSGKLGLGNTVHRSSPVQVGSDTNWRYIAASLNHSSGIKSDNTLWTWGTNNDGQLGDGTQTTRSSPVQTIASGSTWKQVTLGANFTVALKTDGTIWAWGWGGYGQLGNGTGSRSSPTQIANPTTDWRMIACGEHHTLAIKTDGSLWGWGRNEFGQLGNLSTEHTPHRVQTAHKGNNWKSIAAYGMVSVAIKDGSDHSI
jgi:alpha-tubulin suppressor-like RCC1 family protein